MTRRRGFTLIEVMIALVITSLVVTLAYGAAQGGLETGERLAEHQRDGEGRHVTRAMLENAIRHAVVGVRGGAEVFTHVDRVTADGLPADSLTFQSRGIVPPFGTGDAWRVSVWSDGTTVRLLASPEGAGDAPPAVRARLGAGEFDVRLLGHDANGEWRTHWAEADVTPDAVAFDVTGVVGGERDRSVVRVGLERRP